MKLRFIQFVLFLGAAVSAPAQDQFIQTTPLNLGRAGPTATMLKDGRVLVAGGAVTWPTWCITGSTSAEIYDPVTATWSMVPNSLSLDRVDHTALLLDDGRVWITGSYEGCWAPASTDFFDPATGLFTAGPDLPWGMGASDDHSVPMFKLSDGTVLIFNGAPHFADNRVWRFDPTSNSISELGHTLVTSHIAGRSVQLMKKTGEFLLVQPGYWDWAIGDIPAYAEIYNPTTNTSRAIDVPTYVVRFGGTMTSLNDGRVLIFGGVSPDWQSAMPMATYDPVLGTFAQLGDTLYPVNGEPNGVILQDGRVFFADSGCCGRYSIFNPADNSMKQIQLDTGTPAGDQGYGIPVLLNDGRVLIVGGVNGYTQQIQNMASLFLSNTYEATVKAPINPDGSSTFKAKRGVIPVKFSLTQNGTATCVLPPAVISVTRIGGSSIGTVNESAYATAADDGSDFRVDSTACQYVYNLSGAIGVGTYRADISINGAIVGHAVFALQ